MILPSECQEIGGSPSHQIFIKESEATFLVGPYG